ncbi:MAG: hypothetical protein ISS57_12010 [Anaerolineales bacterium]|nr:hypothetical protein [Chloroflexota bacterium]MBL7163324.1 hypothetical protein [Anaerolineales bacterium]
MVPATPPQTTINPVDLLDSALEESWHALCDAFDVTADIPNLRTLFCHADLSAPFKAAETVLVNMILEAIESVDRFSPWYTRPARAYGLISIRNGKLNRFKWMLAPDAIRRWHEELEKLHLAIRKNSGLIQASLLVDQLAMRELSDEPQITAQCNCYPPKIIRINERVLCKTSIVCDDCDYPFAP